MTLRIFWSPDCDVEILAYAYFGGFLTLIDWCHENDIKVTHYDILDLGLKVGETRINKAVRFTNRMDAELCFLRFTDGSRYMSK